MTVEGEVDWRILIEDAVAWRSSERWSDAAAWMLDRAGVDPRLAAWWLVGKDGCPHGP
jgi:hypothetical protein